MKKFVYTALLCCLGLSCKKGFLDQVPNDRLTLDQVFANRTNTESFLADIYAEIPDEACQRFVNSGQGHGNSGPWTGASDEAEYDWSFVTSNDYNIGNWNASSAWVETFWRNYYQGIRNATYLIQNVNDCKECGVQLNTRYTAEARALRAMFYFYLMRMFGPVVMLGDQSIAPDASLGDIQLPRTGFDSCVSWVTSELDKAAADLPVSYNNDEIARITKGIALAFKQEVLFMAARPLYNGNSDYAAMVGADGKPLINQTYDANKWTLAAASAKAFITQFVPTTYDLFTENDANGNFSAFLSCRDVMLTDWNKEWILARPANANSCSTRQYETTPYHNGAQAEDRGSGGLAVTQTMVDAFFMANGLPITDPNSGYQTGGFTDYQAPDDDTLRPTYNQWINREPRFYVDVTYTGRLWLNRNSGDVVTYTNYTGNSGLQIGGNDYSRTGYIVRKNMALGDWRNGGRGWILYRLANVYLNYIEALNESNPSDPDILKYLNLIRQRAGVPLYGSAGLPVPPSQDAMRTAIRMERRVELAFENVRFFDTRQWKIATTTDNGPFYGLNITQDPPGFYTVTSFENRVFQQKHYLFPIPQNEINIDKNLVQNSGW
ncbi:RagB/SusD family nutrient uptake outer membrane protein [Dinghuibacter silviterrae]|uniref:Putative outer membrane starch-binding protein n=1 Tax=Dinghuibacter silviterrae TaxID=1539049 RepID=A0A4R8DGH2_9BACT|nr:RagB/SusD family nutrient uptake outer membrane protein [Dinghuibacter silviterrae]TDW96743.1 putative outer membrane starch-binding protein [Dinghuibacter silviterrae]